MKKPKKVKEKVDGVLRKFCEVTRNAVEELGRIELSGVKIESGMVRKMLVINEQDIDQHIVLQPGLVVYWGVKESEVRAIVERFKGDFEAWDRITYRKIRNELIADMKDGDKPTIMDIRSEMEYRYGTTLEKKRKMLAMWEKRLATITALCDGVRQKGFSIQQYVKLLSSEKEAKDSV